MAPRQFPRRRVTRLTWLFFVLATITSVSLLFSDNYRRSSTGTTASQPGFEIDDQLGDSKEYLQAKADSNAFNVEDVEYPSNLEMPITGGDRRPPIFVKELLDAPPMQTWTPPRLEDGNAFILLHVFSTSSSESRARRTLRRQYSPLHVIPEHYRHLVEMIFVLGYPDIETRNHPEVIREEEEIKREMELYGDMVRLDGLYNGDNVDEGKSWNGPDGSVRGPVGKLSG